MRGVTYAWSNSRSLDMQPGKSIQRPMPLHACTGLPKAFLPAASLPVLFCGRQAISQITTGVSVEFPVLCVKLQVKSDLR
jgi:hypothetical protein